MGSLLNSSAEKVFEIFNQKNKQQSFSDLREQMHAVTYIMYNICLNNAQNGNMYCMRKFYYLLFIFIFIDHNNYKDLDFKLKRATT